MNRTPTSGDRISRRHLTRTAGAVAAIGLTPAIAGSAIAQSATPEASPGASPAASPAASPVAIQTPDPNSPFSTTSLPRDEALTKAIGTTRLSDPGSTGGDLIEISISDAAILNPALRQDGNSYQITSKVYEPLMTADPVTGAFVPQLADSWEMSADGLRWRFHIHPGVTFHDGTPLTADDVVFTYNATTDPDSLAPNRATIVAVLASVQKLDDLTVELVAKFPSSAFLFQTASLVPIMPKHIWEPIAVKDWGTAPGSTGQDPKQIIGTGPFTFVEWVQNDHITLNKNPTYWLKDWTPVYDRYIFRVIADANAAVQSLLAGESDLAPLSPSQAQSITKSNPDFTVYNVGTPVFAFYMTNLDPSHTDLFKDVRVREALLYGIDRKLLVDTVYLGYAEVADSYAQPPGSPGYDPAEMKTVYAYDPDKAKQLLSDAGWTAGDGGKLSKDGKAFSFEIMYDESEPTDQQLIPYFQQAWGALGIDLKTKPMPFPSIIDAVNRRDYDMIQTSFGYYAPDGNTGLLFRTDAQYPAGYNMAYYSNPEYDKLDDEQLHQLDAAKRKALLIQQSNVVNDDLPWAVLVWLKAVSASHPRVHNLIPTGIAAWWTLLKVWVDKS
ncbi:MAG TPA: ABC transporter substrate-binding protein [Thermomicrobiales bacterium]|nr:ABC transporter substrate-binding protein [Thermomicrobiales bacterium]